MTQPRTESSDDTNSELKASIFQRLHPRIYLERFLAENVRPDGRDPTAFREIGVNVGSISTAQGSALVRLGSTTIVCGVKAEIAEPDLERPNEGFLVPNLDLPAICSPKFKPGPPTEEAQVLSERLNEVLLASDVLPLSSLCIHPAKSAWVLYVDAICINYDGNAFDAALVAMVAALRNTRLPRPTYDPETGLTTCSRELKDPLQINCMPISMSFGIFDSTHTLADPTAFEEPLLDTALSVVLDHTTGNLISVSQVGLGSGAGGGEDDSLLSCISAAKKRREELVLAKIYE